MSKHQEEPSQALGGRSSSARRGREAVPFRTQASLCLDAVGLEAKNAKGLPSGGSPLAAQVGWPLLA